MARRLKSPWKVAAGIFCVLWGVAGIARMNTLAPSQVPAAAMGDFTAGVFLLVVLLCGVALIRSGWPKISGHSGSRLTRPWQPIRERSRSAASGLKDCYWGPRQPASDTPV